MKSRAAAALLALTLLGGSLTPPAAAQTAPFVRAENNGAWAVLPTPADPKDPAPPPHFRLRAYPGDTIRDSITVSNLTKKPMTLKLYGADAYNLAESGAFALRGAAEQQVGPGRWIELPRTQIKLRAERKAIIPIKIKVPRNAGPGDHVGGVVALNPEPEQTTANGGLKLKVTRAVGTRVYLKVYGNVFPRLSAQNVQVGRSQPPVPVVTHRNGKIDYVVSNPGNTTLKPRVRVWATGLFGRKLRKLPDRPLPELLPGQSVRISEKWPGLPAVGPVELKVEADAGTGVRSTATAGFTAIPWPTVAGLAVLLLLIGGLLIRRRRNRAAE